MCFRRKKKAEDSLTKKETPVMKKSDRVESQKQKSVAKKPVSFKSFYQ